MRELDGTGVADAVVVMLALEIGPTKMFQRSINCQYV